MKLFRPSLAAVTTVLIIPFILQSVEGFAVPTKPRKLLKIPPSRPPTCCFSQSTAETSPKELIEQIVVEKEETEGKHEVVAEFELSRECDVLATNPNCENLAHLQEHKEEASDVTREVLAGIVVALATVPTSIAYAGVAGVDPLTGLWSSVIVGGIVALAGKSPGVISGAAGVVAVPMGALASLHGRAMVPVAAFLAGVLEALFGCFRLGGLMRFVTAATMDGFLNGFGLYLFALQKKVLQSGGSWLPGMQLPFTAVSMAMTTFLAGWALPKFRDSPKSPKVFRAIPPALGALVTVSCLSHALRLPLATLADVASPQAFAGGLSSLPSWPPVLPSLKLSSLINALPTALSVALIGVLETLLAARLVNDADNDENVVTIADESTDTSNGACIALGAGNAVSAAFGGFGGCGLLPQTILNTQSGGRTALSGIAFATALALSTVAAAPLIGKIPLAAIGGIMLVVANSTVQWRGTRQTLRKAVRGTGMESKANAIALLLTTGVCFVGEFGVGVLLGAATCAVGTAFDGILKRKRKS